MFELCDIIKLTIETERELYIMIIILCYIQNSRRIYEDRTMCKILEKIGGLNAGELLSKYNISLTPPINLSLLIERIGISAYSVDFTEAEEAAKYKQIPGDPKIL